MKGYFLKVSAMRIYSLWLYVNKSAARSCHVESCTSLGNIGWTSCLALCWVQIFFAMINIIGNVVVYLGPVDGGLGEVSHLLCTSVLVVELSGHPFIQLRGYTHSFSLYQYSILHGQLIPGAPEVACYVGNFLVTFMVNQYTALWIGSLSRAPLAMFNLSGERYMLHMFWCNLIGMFSFLEGN